MVVFVEFATKGYISYNVKGNVGLSFCYLTPEDYPSRKLYGDILNQPDFRKKNNPPDGCGIAIWCRCV